MGCSRREENIGGIDSFSRKSNRKENEGAHRTPKRMCKDEQSTNPMINKVVWCY